MKKPFLLSLYVLLGGCAISPDKIAYTDSQTLCRVYGASLNVNYLDPRIKEELDRRGHGSCTDPRLVMAKDAQSTQLLMMGTQMIQSTQNLPPYGYGYAPPVNCLSNRVGGMTQTTCQ